MVFIIKKHGWLFALIAIVIVMYIFFSIIFPKFSVKQLDIFADNPNKFDNTLWVSDNPKAYFACKKGTLIKNGQIVVNNDVYNFNLLTQMTAYYIDIDNNNIHSICKMSLAKQKDNEIKFKIVGDQYGFFKNYDCITFKKTEFSSEEELNKALEKLRFYPSDGGMEYGVYFGAE